MSFHKGSHSPWTIWHRTISYISNSDVWSRNVSLVHFYQYGKCFGMHTWSPMQKSIVGKSGNLGTWCSVFLFLDLQSTDLKKENHLNFTSEMMRQSEERFKAFKSVEERHAEKTTRLLTNLKALNISSDCLIISEITF